MKPKINTRLNCGAAKWDRTVSGRLDPFGDGRCMWIPPPTPSNYINRRYPCEDCAGWEPLKKPAT